MKLKNKLMVAIPACALAVTPVVAATACSSKKEQPKTKLHVVPTAAQKTKNVNDNRNATFEFNLTDTPVASDLTVEAIDSTDDSIEIQSSSISVSEKKLTFVATIKSDYEFHGDKTFTFSVKVTNNNTSSQWSETVTGVKINFTPGDLQTITLSMTETTVEYTEKSTTALKVTECFPKECEIKNVKFTYDNTKITIDDDGYIKALTTTGSTPVTVTATDSKGNLTEATCTVTNQNTVTTLTISEEKNKANHNITASNYDGYEFKVFDDKNREQTAYVNSWTVTPSEAGSFNGNKFIPTPGLGKTISAKVTATMGGVTSAAFDIEVASFDLLDQTKLANGEAAKASTLTTFGEANLLIPSRYYNVATNAWKTITDIPSNAFNIAETVQTIWKVYIPKSILKNGFSTQAFGQTQIKKIEVDSENADFTSKDRWSGDYNCVMLKKADANPDTLFKATIQPFYQESSIGDLTTIGQDAFMNVQLVESAQKIDIQSLTTIEQQAFKNCNLTKFNLVANLNNIKDYAFQGCTNLFEDEGAGLYAAQIGGDKLTNIGKYAFQGCKNLNLVYTSFENATNLEAIGDHAFEGCGQNDPSTGGFASYIYFNSCSKLASIGSSCFKDFQSLMYIFFPEAIEHIGSNVIKGCEWMGGEGGSSLGFDGFVDGTQFIGNNGKHNFVWLPDEESVENADFLLGENGQYEINKSNQFELEFDGSEVTIVGGSADEDEVLEIPTVHKVNTTCDVVAIGEEAFAGDEEIYTLNLNSCAGTLRSIGDSAFSGCSWLTDIYVDAYTSVPSKSQLQIADNAFENVSSFGTIHVNSNLSDQQVEEWKNFWSSYLPFYEETFWTVKRL